VCGCRVWPSFLLHVYIIDFKKNNYNFQAGGGGVRQSRTSLRKDSNAVRYAGAQNWAVIASLIETCKLNGIEPHGYLSGVLTAIAGGHKQTDIKLLLPWNNVNPV